MPSDLWASPTWQGIRQRKNKMMGQCSVESFINRPPEEAYDLKNGPNELRNLAADPAHAETLTVLRRRLPAWQNATNDLWTILYRDKSESRNLRKNRRFRVDRCRIGAIGAAPPGGPSRVCRLARPEQLGSPLERFRELVQVLYCRIELANGEGGGVA